MRRAFVRAVRHSQVRWQGLHVTLQRSFVAVSRRTLPQPQTTNTATDDD